MLDKNSRAVLKAAHEAMRAGYCGRVSSLHLLIGLLDTPSPIRTFLAKEEVDLDALRGAVGLAQSSDGIVGGPQLRLAPDAKRAIERAKRLAMRGQTGQLQKRISPEHLWMVLLPHAVLWHERLRVASEPDEPLQTVWRRYNSAPLQLALRSYLGNELPASNPLGWMSQPLWAGNSPNQNKIHLKFWPVTAGLAWHLWFFASMEWGLWMLIFGTLTGITVMLGGAALRSRPVRDGAASWLCGLILGIFLTWIVGASLN